MSRDVPPVTPGRVPAIPRKAGKGPQARTGMEIEVGTGISTRLGVRVGIGSTLTSDVGAKEQ